MNKGTMKMPPHGLGDSGKRNFQTIVASGMGAVMGPYIGLEEKTNFQILQYNSVEVAGSGAFYLTFGVPSNFKKGKEPLRKTFSLHYPRKGLSCSKEYLCSEQMVQREAVSPDGLAGDACQRQ